MNHEFSNERDKRFYDTYGTFRGPHYDIGSILCDLQTEGPSISVLHTRHKCVYNINI